MIGTLLNGCNPSVPECGLKKSRIVNGTDALPGSWPYAAIIGTPTLNSGIQGL